MKNLLWLAIPAMAVTSPARADWQWTKWGMSPDEVVAASGGSAHRIDVSEGGTYRDGSIQLVDGVHKAGSRSFHVKFIFKDNRLSNVQLRLEDVAASQCYSLETDLLGLYGEPVAKSNGSGGDILSRKWADRANNNQIAFLFVTWSTTGCQVTYAPIVSEETRGL